jgi:hypothetical protein
VKTVVKQWAKIFTSLKDPTSANNTMPEFYTRVEKTRAIDMANALASNLGNAYILDSNNTIVDPTTLGVNSMQNAPGDLYVTPPVATNKNYTITTWDTILKNMYAKYIKQNVTASRVFPEVKDFKAIMLHESDGNPKATSPTGATGLFQLTGIALLDILGYQLSPADRLQYYEGERNADVAFKYIVKLVEYIRKGLVSAGINPDEVSATDFRFLVTIAYNQGPTITNKAIKQVKANGEAITYKNVEAYAIVTRMFSQEALHYVPTIEFIKSNTSDVV